ncbi:MAG: dTDP-4-dehydrorhamnose reductase [Psychroserpens sp.]|uniref:dTDP-4-dehydrorhamnose reductase n=1 Tax=Psychroserpens sp. TaxID=2020870 RepID=UPI003C756800
MINVLVTGANGQLGKSIQSIQGNYPDLKFQFTGRHDLDITNKQSIEHYFESNAIDFCINCAAYTAVDKAENDSENAEKINVTAVKHLAVYCESHAVKLIHISTDFVFDGKQHKAYLESQSTNPLGVYGRTKLDGEKEVATHSSRYFIIRTSWLYSEFNQNFLRTMLRLAQERDHLEVVSDQIGTPTYAKDLAKALLNIIKIDSVAFGIYHYSNEGVASWYDFAKAIFEITNNGVFVNPLPTSSYPTLATRPHFSVLDKKKFKDSFDMTVPYWRDSLRIALKELIQN